MEIIETLSAAMVMHGAREHIRSDNGFKMTSKTVLYWLATVETRTLLIEPGSPSENGITKALTESYVTNS